MKLIFVPLYRFHNEAVLRVIFSFEQNLRVFAFNETSQGSTSILYLCDLFTDSRIAERSVDNELERMWKESVVVEIEFSGGTFRCVR